MRLLTRRVGVRLDLSRCNAGCAANNVPPDAPTADEVDVCKVSKALLRDELTEPWISLAADCRSPVEPFAESKSCCAASRAADTPSEAPPSKSEAVLETVSAVDFAASASTATHVTHASNAHVDVEMWLGVMSFTRKVWHDTVLRPAEDGAQPDKAEVLESGVDAAASCTAAELSLAASAMLDAAWLAESTDASGRLAASPLKGASPATCGEDLTDGSHHTSYLTITMVAEALTEV